MAEIEISVDGVKFTFWPPASPNRASGSAARNGFNFVIFFSELDDGKLKSLTEHDRYIQPFIINEWNMYGEIYLKAYEKYKDYISLV